MMCRSLPALVLVGVVSWSGLSTVCATDQAPAATLLFPSMVFDYAKPIDGDNTNIAIINLSSEATLVRLTLWSDLDVPFLSFNIALSGYDVETMNARDLLFHGRLPDTGTAGGLMVNGPEPFADGPTRPEVGGLLDSSSTATLEPFCQPGDDGYPNHATLSNGVLEVFEMILRESQVSLKEHLECDGDEVSTDRPNDWFLDLHTGMPVRFYATADVVQRCDSFFPDGAEYWNETIGDDNVLTGDVLWTNNSERLSEGSSAVHIESGYESASGGFYSRWTTELDAKPAGREPLPTAWAFRYFGAGDDALDTQLRVWKGWLGGSSVADLAHGDGWLASIACNSYTIYAFDEDENVISLSEDPWPWPTALAVYPNLLPLSTQEVDIDEFWTPATSGWMLLVWPPSNHADGAYQTWVGTRFTAFETFSAHTGSTPVGNANCFPNQVLPDLGIGDAGRSVATQY